MIKYEAKVSGKQQKQVNHSAQAQETPDSGFKTVASETQTIEPEEDSLAGSVIHNNPEVVNFVCEEPKIPQFTLLDYLQPQNELNQNDYLGYDYDSEMYYNEHSIVMGAQFYHYKTCHPKVHQMIFSTPETHTIRDFDLFDIS